MYIFILYADCLDYVKETTNYGQAYELDCLLGC
jgi:hypothetical protein